MAANETRVLYKAIADFTELGRKVRAARKDIAALRKEEALLNAQSAAGSTAATTASKKKAKSTEAVIDAFEKEAASVGKSTVKFIENASAAQKNSEAVKENSSAVKENAQASKTLAENVAVSVTKWRKINGVMVDVTNSTNRSTNASRRNRAEMTALGNAFTRTLGSAQRLNKGLDRIGNWRPRLTPPFIALIPVIGGVLALINPLVAGLGAAGGAAIGFASSLGRVAAGAIGAIPALATLLSVVSALKMAFGGIGGAFKAFSNMKAAGGGGGGGGGGSAPAAAPEKAELTFTERLQRAQEAYARSIQDVRFAQEDLDDTRKGYIQRLKELQKAVDRAAQSEARAAANSQLAKEEYANVLADPGSTKGQKMMAKVDIDDAQTEYQDVLDENKQNAIDLAKLKQDGIDGDREVIMATRGLTDAINAQRDAQIDLMNAQTDTNEAIADGGGGGGGGGAVDLYKEALDKLSPSARRFVEELVAMKDAWDDVKRNVQESFFSEFVGDLWRIKEVLPSVESLLSDTAGALGRVAREFLLLVTSPEWQKDLVLIGEQNVPIIENIGGALLAWVDIFKDLSIAAGPFLIALTDGLREGAENFQSIVKDARADGSLASYLEEVRQRMEQWWRIVKNVGVALFNYSAAAGEFGTWLTDGLERMTEGWRTASEEARKEGSPFQQYLEDIKPLLSEVKGLFGDFFGWFARTASDPDNIAAFTDIVKMIREDLGPALGEIFELLAKSGVGEDFVGAIVSIIEAIATLLENGGIDGIKAFYDTVTALFDFFKTMGESVPEPLLKLLATTFGTLAALRFLGLSKILGLLIKLGTSSGLLKILDKLPLIGAAGSGGAHAGKGGLLSNLKLPVLPAGAGGAAIGAGAIAGGGLAGIAGLVDGIKGSLDPLKSYFENGGLGTALNGTDKEKAAQDRNMGDAAANFVIPPGLQGILSLLAPEALADMKSNISDVLVGVMDVQRGVQDFFTITLPGWVASIGDGFWEGMQGLGGWLAEQWDGAVQWFIDLPYNIGVAVGTLWGNLLNFWDWLVEQWNNAVVWFNELPQKAADAAGDIWKDLQKVGPWLAARWEELRAWFADLPQRAADTAGDIWRNLQKVGPWLAARWEEVRAWFAALPQNVANAAGDVWRNIQTVGNWLGDMGTEIWNWAVNLPNMVANAIGDLFRFVTKNFDAGVKVGTSATGHHYGGPIKRARGGSVPGRGNSDTVPAMLTPGEFVVRKAIVGRVGMENMIKFNAGVMSYAEMLQHAMGNQPSGGKGKEGGSTGLSFLNGGGLVPDIDFGNFGQPPAPSGDGPRGFGGDAGGGRGLVVEQLIINNPEPEKASDSLPKSIRKVSYLENARV